MLAAETFITKPTEKRSSCRLSVIGIRLFYQQFPAHAHNNPSQLPITYSQSEAKQSSGCTHIARQMPRRTQAQPILGASGQVSCPYTYAPPLAYSPACPLRWFSSYEKLAETRAQLGALRRTRREVGLAKTRIQIAELHARGHSKETMTVLDCVSEGNAVCFRYNQ